MGGAFRRAAEILDCFTTSGSWLFVFRGHPWKTDAVVALYGRGFWPFEEIGIFSQSTEKRK